MASRALIVAFGVVAVLSPAVMAVAQMPVAQVGATLRYQGDGAGNQLPDFSEAGYGAPGQAIPQVPVVERVASGGSAEIQAAIDRVSQRAPDANGIRGAVLLAPGTFVLDDRIEINASGVVLRGSGIGRGGTLLSARLPMPIMVLLDGSGKPVDSATPIGIASPVRIGARTIVLAGNGGFKVGDTVIVQRPFTAAWIHAIGMDQIPGREDGHAVKQWEPSDGIGFERVVTAVSGNAITLDAPITDRLFASEGATVRRYSFPGRISNAGIEDIALRGVSLDTLKAAGKGNPTGDTGIKFQRVVNGWGRNLRVDEFATFIDIGRSARDVTVDGVTGAVTQGPRSPAVPFVYNIAGQRSLIQNCAFQGNRVHVWTTQAATAGPNVFRRCSARGTKLDAGPHQRWASGTLYEGLTITGEFGLDDRANFGTGQGWAGGSQVLWNSSATDGIKLGQAPGSYNWSIGSQGQVTENPDDPGVSVSPGRPVAPVSLFDAQVRQASTR